MSNLANTSLILDLAVEAAWATAPATSSELAAEAASSLQRGQCGWLRARVGGRVGADKLVAEIARTISSELTVDVAVMASS
ncbi:hypothetical protein E2562_025228 [Oryza meyeriana var. granulata]|uniref:Uncharacterized protein n=1 Tax=Oryza meyeriana var. granulata TaxID=110450 RepID=A0A6G1BZJ2_9ORYZ|nr:hypothetical protein E2562_025228 [Oryza meyeriana var. granulata]